MLMSNGPRPLSAYEKWELQSFDPAATSPLDPDQQKSPIPDEQLAAIAKMRDEAVCEGRAQGYAAGFKEGTDAAAARISTAIDELRATGAAFATETAQVNEVASAKIFEITVEVVRSLLATALAVNPKLIVPFIDECLKEIPGVKDLRIKVAPQTSEMVRQAFDKQIRDRGWVIYEDSALTPGECMLDSTTNHFDGTFKSRMAYLLECLNADTSWAHANEQ